MLVPGKYKIIFKYFSMSYALITEKYIEGLMSILNPPDPQLTPCGCGCTYCNIM